MPVLTTANVLFSRFFPPGAGKTSKTTHTVRRGFFRAFGFGISSGAAPTANSVIAAPNSDVFVAADNPPRSSTTRPASKSTTSES